MGVYFKKCFRTVLLGLCGFVGVALGASASGLRQMPIEAIPYTGFLSKADFDERFPGELRESAAALPRGWYVTYQHEALVYWFGPVRFRSTAEDYEAQLRGIVDAATRERPDLQGYTIAVREAPVADQSAQPELGSPPEARSPSSPPSEPEPPSFLERLFRVFRRG